MGGVPEAQAQGARILRFAGATRVEEPEYGPFSQPGTLDGVPIVVGGENDPVPVRLETPERIHNCLASRDLAKRIGMHLFTTPLRVTGVGRWFRDREGVWKMKSFRIHDYTELRSESIADATRRLHSIDAGWKERDDPFGELVAGGGCVIVVPVPHPADLVSMSHRLSVIGSLRDGDARGPDAPFDGARFGARPRPAGLDHRNGSTFGSPVASNARTAIVAAIRGARNRELGCQLGCQSPKPGPISVFRKSTMSFICNGLRWCRGPESNWRHHDFQSCALPTELPRHV